MQTRLILVEGVPYSGKSTLSEFVAQQLALNGRPARWVNEGAMLHRFFRHVLAVLERRQTVDDEALAADWRAFVQTALASPDTFVVDGALSFAAVWPLLAADRPEPAILAALEGIAGLCARLHPRVIHLTGAVERITRASYAGRGPAWEDEVIAKSDPLPYQQARGRSGAAGVTAFLQDAQDLTGRVLADGGWPTLTLDVTAGDWPAYRRRVLGWLGLAEVAVDRPVLSLADLHACAGTYVSTEPDAAGQTLTVRLEHGALILHAPRRRIGPLEPLSAARWRIAGTGLEIEFGPDDFVGASAQALQLRLFPWTGATHVFRRCPDPSPASG